MSQHFVSLSRWRLLDGRELHIEADGVHVGERLHPLMQIQEARLLFLRPETLALRMSDVGQVEYSFVRQGDGVAALETLYHLRPDLRRADTPAPAPEAPPGYFAPIPAPAPLGPAPQLAPGQPGQPYGQPYAPYGAARAPRPGPAAPTPFPPQVIEAYGPQPNRAHAELTPVPRTTRQLIGAAFRLAGKRVGALLVLTLLVATLPMAGIAILDAIASALDGVNPLAGAQNPLDTIQQMASGQGAATTTSTATTTPTPLSTVIGLLALCALILTLLVAAWSQATLVIGAREATLGRPIAARACMREGLARLWPTLLALSLLYVALGVIAAPGLALALAFATAPGSPGSGIQFTPQLVTTFGVIGGLIAAVTLLALAYVWSRLALYPAAAALGLPQPLRLSLALTGFGWRRVFAALLVVTLLTGALTLGANAAQLLSVAVATIVVAPLAQVIAAPLGALIRVVTLYDQRLRREGYALFMQERIAPPQQQTPPSTAEAERRSEVGG